MAEDRGIGKDGTELTYREGKSVYEEKKRKERRRGCIKEAYH